MEDYKKKYEKSLERAKGIYNETIVPTPTAKWTCGYIFPELEESKEEKIIKTLKEIANWGCAKNISVKNDVELKDCIAWLEKKGEQKPFDYEHANIQQRDFALKVEPKFKVGDWITDGNSAFQIINVDDGYYFANDGGCVCFGVVHQYYHLWTIKDVKDCDVLEFGDHGRLVIGIVSHVNKVTGKVDVSCLLEDNTFKLGNFYALDTIKPHPATQEQCKLLFTKMKEAGYEWDVEKKELKQIEQEEDVELTDFESALFSAFSDAWQEYLLGKEVDVEKWAREHSAELLEVAREQISDWGEKKPIPKFKVGDCIYDKRDSYNRNVVREVGDDYYINAFGQKMDMAYTNANFEFLKHLEDDHNDSKSAAWSEEDEQNLNGIVATMEEDAQLPKDTIKRLCKWLKSLEYRVQPQSKQEWSEEDEHMFKRFVDLISQCMTAHGYNEMFNWLKSLKERYTWKPSDLPHWKKSTLPNNNTTGFNSDYFCHKGYCINYKELFEKLPKDD